MASGDCSVYLERLKKRKVTLKQCEATVWSGSEFAEHCFVFSNLSFFLVFPVYRTRSMKQSLNVCLSVKSLSLFDFCFLERRILLEMERKRMFCRMISISQTCLYLIKFSVEVYLFQWTENWKYYFGKSIVRRIVQGHYWKPIKSYTLLCFIPTSTSMLLMIYSMY